MNKQAHTALPIVSRITVQKVAARSGQAGSRRREAFTLVELLVVIVIIGVLVAITMPVFGNAIAKSRQLTTLNNMKQVGTAFLLYSQDNNSQLPNRISIENAGTSDRWPKIISAYVQNVLAYNSPIPGYLGTPYQVTDPSLLVSNTENHTNYMANGYSDLGAYSNASIAPRLSNLTSPSQVILLGIPLPGRYNFYMDFTEGDNNTLLDRNPWSIGSIYVFCDGSARLLQYNSALTKSDPPPTGADYTDWLWLFDKNNTSVIK